MDVRIFDTPEAAGAAAATQAAAVLRESLAAKPRARLILATGASQLPTLAALAREPGIDWSRVDGFHLDEYIGLPSNHPASFCRYLRERFVSLVGLGSMRYLDGTAEPDLLIEEAGEALVAEPVDLGLIGIGENGHLAFNDPPADFRTEQPYLIVSLDRHCRQQQVDEGWFATLDDVPTRAVSMSVRQILKCNRLICSVPDRRKAVAVRGAVQGPVDPAVPASILQTHPSATIYLDRESASLLEASEADSEGRAANRG